MEKGHVVERELFDSQSGRWIRSSIYPTIYRTQEGRAIFIHMVQDITERKMAEEKIKESEQKYITLIENANDAIYILQEGCLGMSTQSLRN